MSKCSQVSVSDLCLSSAFRRDLIFQKLFITSFQAPKISCTVSGKGRAESSASLSFGCDNLSCQRAYAAPVAATLWGVL